MPFLGTLAAQIEKKNHMSSTLIGIASVFNNAFSVALPLLNLFLKTLWGVRMGGRGSDHENSFSLTPLDIEKGRDKINRFKKEIFI